MMPQQLPSHSPLAPLHCGENSLLGARAPFRAKIECSDVSPREEAAAEHHSSLRTGFSRSGLLLTCPPPPAEPLAFVPPLRFAMVEDGLFRGAYPTLRSFPFLRTLRLRTIVSLTPEKPTYDLLTFAASEHITLKHQQVERFKGEVLLSAADLTTALQVILSPESYPLFIHCLDGRYVVGMLILALRRLQCWDPAASRMEYLRFAPEIQEDLSVVNDFSGPVLSGVPSWMAKNGMLERLRKKNFGGVKLRFPTAADATASAQDMKSSSVFTSKFMDVKQQPLTPIPQEDVVPSHLESMANGEERRYILVESAVSRVSLSQHEAVADGRTESLPERRNAGLRFDTAAGSPDRHSPPPSPADAGYNFITATQASLRRSKAGTKSHKRRQSV